VVSKRCAVLGRRRIPAVGLQGQRLLAFEFSILEAPPPCTFPGGLQFQLRGRRGKSLFLRDLIYGQRWAPICFLTKHRIEDHYQPVHARHYCNVSGFSCGAKALVESPDDRIATQRCLRTHVKHRTHLVAPTSDPTLSIVPLSRLKGATPNEPGWPGQGARASGGTPCGNRRLPFQTDRRLSASFRVRAKTTFN
jgi:hypothetical protein